MGESILNQGVDLMLFGMGTVFVFLTVLVGCVLLMSRVVQRYFPEPDIPLNAVKSRPLPPTKQQQVPEQVLRVIQEAIHQHRSKNK